MAVVVVGGHSRNVGKTSVVAGIIAAVPEANWTAAKITQFGHGVCSVTTEPCDCALNESEHSWSLDEEFDRSGKIAREKYKELKTFDVETDRVDLIYYSAIPWISFTSFKHASRQNNRQTVPRMVFGGMFEDGPKRKMPFSVEVHHALVDGIHVGKFYKLFQAKLDSV